MFKYKKPLPVLVLLNHRVENLEINSDFSTDAFPDFLQAIKANRSLKTLSVGGIFTVEQLTRLFDVLKDHPTLKALKVTGAFIPRYLSDCANFYMKLKVMCQHSCSLESLDFEGTNIGDSGVQAIVQGSLNNPKRRLVRLNLRSTDMTTDGLLELCKLISPEANNQYEHPLRYLHLSNINYTFDDAKSFEARLAERGPDLVPMQKQFYKAIETGTLWQLDFYRTPCLLGAGAFSRGMGADAFMLAVALSQNPLHIECDYPHVEKFCAEALKRKLEDQGIENRPLLGSLTLK